MSLLDRFFIWLGGIGYRLPRRAPSLSAAAVIAAMKARRTPCVQIVRGGEGRSRLGGVPDMAAEWPRYRGRALGCVAQLELSEIRAAGGPDWLPGAGRLIFFYEYEHAGWGSEAKDAGSFAVIHETDAALPSLEPDDLLDDARYPPYPVAFVAGVSYPNAERLGVGWDSLDDEQSKILEAARDELPIPTPAHQIGGYPQAIQNDTMELECDNIATGRHRYFSAENMTAAQSEWRLLLQLDTDDDAGAMWGDTGMIYFWVRERDARAGDFSKVWMILQCF